MTPPTPHTQAQLEEVARLLREAEAAAREYQQLSGLRCPPRCGSCCESPRVEATPLECLPLARALVDSGEGTELAQTLRAALGSSGARILCPLYRAESGAPGLGRCSRYAERPLVCRLFGFAGGRDREGRVQLARCRVMKERGMTPMPGADGAALEPPVFEDFARRLAGIDPSLGSTPLPMTRALLIALERTLLEDSYAEASSRTDSPRS